MSPIELSWTAEKDNTATLSTEKFLFKSKSGGLPVCFVLYIIFFTQSTLKLAVFVSDTKHWGKNMEKHLLSPFNCNYTFTLPNSDQKYRFFLPKKYTFRNNLNLLKRGIQFPEPPCWKWIKVDFGSSGRGLKEIGKRNRFKLWVWPEW